MLSFDRAILRQNATDRAKNRIHDLVMSVIAQNRFRRETSRRPKFLILQLVQ